jgi:hypothetical protein
MCDEEIAIFCAAVDVDAIQAYRRAIGQKTHQIVKKLRREDLKQKVLPERIQRLPVNGVLVESEVGLAVCWGNRTIVGLLVMPATKHNMSHLNEALRLR